MTLCHCPIVPSVPKDHSGFILNGQAVKEGITILKNYRNHSPKMVLHSRGLESLETLLSKPQISQGHFLLFYNIKSANKVMYARENLVHNHREKLLGSPTERHENQ
jgi:hypothetical protein